MNYELWLSKNKYGTPIKYTKWCNTQNIVPNFHNIKGLMGADFSWAKLSWAKLSWAKLSWANLRGADLERADLTRANLSQVNSPGTKFRNANLTDANLTGAYSPGANFRDANLKNANFRGANLVEANFRNANLTGANFRDANLTDANLTGANFQDADFQDANLRGADLWSARGIVPIGGIGSKLRMAYFVQHKNSVKVLHEGFWGTTDEFIVRGYEYDTENSIPHDSPQSKGLAYKLASQSAIFTLAQQQES